MGSEFIIKFDGRQHQIDANVLINNLLHTSNIIQEVNKELHTGKKIDIKIKATRRGSFKLHIDLIETVLPILNMFNAASVSSTLFILEVFIELIKLKIFLEGEKPKEIQHNESSITVKRNDGKIMNFNNCTVNLYTGNALIDEALSKSFETIENDPSITGYQITDTDDTPKLEVKREDFEHLSSRSKIVYHEERVINDPQARLKVIKVSFDMKLKWEFYYNGNKITAKVDDPRFQTLIDKGEAFAKGDVLVVVLEIKQRINKATRDYGDISHRVIEIIEHTKWEKPKGLF